MPSRSAHEAISVMRQNVQVVQALFPDFFDHDDSFDEEPMHIWPERALNDQQMQRRAVGYGRPQGNRNEPNRPIAPLRFPSIRQLENRRRRNRKLQCEEEESVDR